MQIEFYCPRWGSENISWDNFCGMVKDAGYDGVEYSIARNVSEKELDAVWNTFEKNGLKILPQHFDTYEADYSKHLDLYSQWIEKIGPYPCERINSQTGKDFFSFDQNRMLIDIAIDSGLNIIHETHRNKFSFAAHITKEYLQQIPNLKIALDASHWVCVAESYLENQAVAMDLAIERTNHIHARVGYPEGPQVPDPRIPDYHDALQKHLNWWDKVVQRKKAEGGQLTITPEFGPFPYMVQVPETGKPITNQWEVNLWMKELLTERYK